MNINTPLFELEVIGDTDNAVLKANRTEMLCRGSKEYCLSMREEIIANRGFTAPQDWDIKWAPRNGPTWMPDKLSELTCHLTPDSYALSSDTSNAEDVVEWADETDNGILFKPRGAAKAPHEANEIGNHVKFKGAELDGIVDYIYGVAHCDGDEFDVGSGVFMFALMIRHGVDKDSERYILSTDNARDYALTAESSDTFKTYRIYIGNSTSLTLNTSINWWDNNAYSIILCGKSGSQLYIKVDGGDNQYASGVGSTNLASNHQLYIGARQNMLGTATVAGTFWDGTMYEFMFFDGSLLISDMEKIEGYLAHKYGQESLLPDTHTYKDNPPREGI